MVIEALSQKQETANTVCAWPGPLFCIGGCRPISKQWELGILYTRDKFHAPPYYEFALCHLVVVEDLIKLFPII